MRSDAMSALLLPLLLSLPAAAAAAKPPKNAILLSQVKTLTLRGDGAQTTHRRLPAVPQLKCLSAPKLCALHPIDVLRCTNQGSGYDAEDVQWSCAANLPVDLKLGNTDVVCEGYSSANDPYVLKGSCGVEYRVVLTDEGERRHPNLAGGNGGWGRGEAGASALPGLLFMVLFVGVFAWIVYSACVAQDRNRRLGVDGQRRGWGGGGGGGGGPGGGWGGGWGGGGGGWQPFNHDDDPPPPYPGAKPSSSNQQGQGWRPGFWSGLAGGAAAGYMAGGRNNNNNNNRNDRRTGFGGGGYGYGTNDGYGWGAGPSRTSSGSSSSARHESTGFGSTNRR
ncbi:Store-operated calcium entry-associated regulatory factor like protein [Verticillium longisporum]|uniref:Store-operated calcium entry-associated regulatory factor n=1 Tax=Verticillium longisporum TaxID=100787 RepID=A0A8I2Z368_VERLO|nr:Store-operated calcium entry-associated regulatory factor like protein [Verticillium longisporum]